MKTINNQRIPVNQKIHQMRINLWMEHFGLPECLCEDPFDDFSYRTLLRNIDVLMRLCSATRRSIVSCSAATPMIMSAK